MELGLKRARKRDENGVDRRDAGRFIRVKEHKGIATRRASFRLIYQTFAGFHQVVTRPIRYAERFPVYNGPWNPTRSSSPAIYSFRRRGTRGSPLMKPVGHRRFIRERVRPAITFDDKRVLDACDTREMAPAARKSSQRSYGRGRDVIIAFRGWVGDSSGLKYQEN